MERCFEGQRLSLVMVFLTVLVIASCGGDEVQPEGKSVPVANAGAKLAEEPTTALDEISEETELRGVPDAGAAVSLPLLDPSTAAMNGTAPDTFLVHFRTTKGEFVLEVHRMWAPIGADRFYNLVRNDYYDGVRFFRVLEGFMAQFGIHGDPEVAAAWDGATLVDDPVRESNTRGRISYAMAGPNSRTTQLFINFGNNTNLDEAGFAPFGEVVEGMDVVGSLYSGYGEGAPSGRGPDQRRIAGRGNAYLERDFPRLDYIQQARVEE